MSQEPTAKIRVLVAPNSMKGSLDAFRFADAVESAFKSVSERFEIRKQAVADGGDYTTEVLSEALGLNQKTISVLDPLGRSINASYGLKGNQAVLEMANCSGMKLLKQKELNPLKTSSYGVGEMLYDAIHNGARDIFLGVGGSATVDGGMGLLEAMGVCFFDCDGELLKSCGENVGKIQNWDDSALADFSKVNILVVCDVDNPLLGDNGAVSVFAPQKGATEEMLPTLENNLQHFATLIQLTKNEDLKNIKGMGAAGGINLALNSFLNAKIELGADLVLRMVNFDKLAASSDIIITGEGKIDEQTANMKAPYAVAMRAKQNGIPVVAIGGEVTEKGAKLFDKVYALVDGNISIEYAVQHAEELVFKKAQQVAEEILNDYGND